MFVSGQWRAQTDPKRVEKVSREEGRLINLACNTVDGFVILLIKCDRDDYMLKASITNFISLYLDLLFHDCGWRPISWFGLIKPFRPPLARVDWANNRIYNGFRRLHFTLTWPPLYWEYNNWYSAVVLLLFVYLCFEICLASKSRTPFLYHQQYSTTCIKGEPSKSEMKTSWSVYHWRQRGLGSNESRSVLESPPIGIHAGADFKLLWALCFGKIHLPALRLLHALLFFTASLIV
jgi:hypothetical protein